MCVYIYGPCLVSECYIEEGTRNYKEGEEATDMSAGGRGPVRQTLNAEICLLRYSSHSIVAK